MPHRSKKAVQQVPPFKGTAALAFGIGIILLLPASAISGDLTLHGALRERMQALAEDNKFAEAEQAALEDIRFNKDNPDGELESWILLGQIYRLQGNYAKARYWIMKGLTALETTCPSDYARLSGAYNYLSLLENSEGSYVASENSARRAIAFWEAADLSDHVGAMHLVVLANALRQQGKYDEGLRNLARALKILARPGSDAALFATAKNNYGALYFWLGDYQKALPILNEALALRIATRGADHTDVANSYLDLGCTEFRLGQTDLAIEHLTKARDIRITKLGIKHPETLSASANLAASLESLGRSDQALPLLAQVVRDGKVVLGPKHPDLAQYEDDYANVLLSKGQIDEARQSAKHALSTREFAFGANSRESAAGLRTIARVELAAHKEPAAIELLNKSAAIYKLANQPSDQDYADTLDELGAVHLARNAYQEAYEAFSNAVNVRAKAAPTAAFAVSLANLAEVQTRLERKSESQATLKKAVDVIISLPASQQSQPDCVAILSRYEKSVSRK